MSARRLIPVVVIAVAMAAAPAAADPVPGATYTGAAGDGATVTFTVSSDGTLVSSYQLVGVQADTCSFYSNGDPGGWPGAPIEQNAFQYQLVRHGLGTSILFQGSFPGAQSASGTFDLHQDATPQSPACDTGTVSWTAATTSTPPQGPGPPGSPGSPGSPGQKGVRFKTRLRLRRASDKLTGRVMSSSGACRAGRTVILWQGSRRIASTKSKAGGKFSFARSSKVRGRRVRVSAPTRTVQAGACAAGSSKFIKG